MKYVLQTRGLTALGRPARHLSCPSIDLALHRRGRAGQGPRHENRIHHRRRLHRPPLRRQSASRDPRGARAARPSSMQAIAAEFNLAETTFVLPPKDAAHTAKVRIFTPKAEMPFAGHPNVGTAFVLARGAAKLRPTNHRRPAGVRGEGRPGQHRPQARAAAPSPPHGLAAPCSSASAKSDCPRDRPARLHRSRPAHCARRTARSRVVRCEQLLFAELESRAAWTRRPPQPTRDQCTAV